jgi:hypothetical protein
MSRIALIVNESDGTIRVETYTRLFGSIWTFKKEILNGKKV